MEATTFKPASDESILAAFSEREKKLAVLRRAGNTTPAVWVVIIGAWLATVWAFFSREIGFPEFGVAVVLLTALATCFKDYRTRLKILSDHLIDETQMQPLVGSGRINSVNSVQKS